MEWFCKYKTIQVLQNKIQYKELLETLNPTKSISSGGIWNDLLNRLNHQYVLF